MHNSFAFSMRASRDMLGRTRRDWISLKAVASRGVELADSCARVPRSANRMHSGGADADLRRFVEQDLHAPRSETDMVGRVARGSAFCTSGSVPAYRFVWWVDKTAEYSLVPSCLADVTST